MDSQMKYSPMPEIPVSYRYSRHPDQAVETGALLTRPERMRMYNNSDETPIEDIFSTKTSVPENNECKSKTPNLDQSMREGEPNECLSDVICMEAFGTLTVDLVQWSFRKLFKRYLQLNRVEEEWNADPNLCEALNGAIDRHLNLEFLMNLQLKQKLGYGDTISTVFIRFFEYIAKAFDSRVMYTDSIMDLKILIRDPNKTRLPLKLIDHYIRQNSIEYRLYAITEEIDNSLPIWVKNNHKWLRRQLPIYVRNHVNKITEKSFISLRDIIYDHLHKRFEITREQFDEDFGGEIFKPVYGKLTAVLYVGTLSCKSTPSRIKEFVTNYSNSILREINKRTRTQSLVMQKMGITSKEIFMDRLMNHLSLSLDWTVLGKGIV